MVQAEGSSQLRDNHLSYTSEPSQGVFAPRDPHPSSPVPIALCRASYIILKPPQGPKDHY